MLKKKQATTTSSTTKAKKEKKRTRVTVVSLDWSCACTLLSSNGAHNHTKNRSLNLLDQMESPYCPCSVVSVCKPCHGMR